MSLWSFSVEGALLVLALVLGEAHCGVGRDRGPVSHSRDKDAMEEGCVFKEPQHGSAYDESPKFFNSLNLVQWAKK